MLQGDRWEVGVGCLVAKKRAKKDTAKEGWKKNSKLLGTINNFFCMGIYPMLRPTWVKQQEVLKIFVGGTYPTFKNQIFSNI